MAYKATQYVDVSVMPRIIALHKSALGASMSEHNIPESIPMRLVWPGVCLASILIRILGFCLGFMLVRVELVPTAYLRSRADFYQEFTSCAVACILPGVCARISRSPCVEASRDFCLREPSTTIASSPLSEFITTGSSPTICSSAPRVPMLPILSTTPHRNSSRPPQTGVFKTPLSLSSITQTRNRSRKSSTSALQLVSTQKGVGKQQVVRRTRSSIECLASVSIPLTGDVPGKPLSGLLDVLLRRRSQGDFFITGESETGPSDTESIAASSSSQAISQVRRRVRRWFSFAEETTCGVRTLEYGGSEDIENSAR